jgi:tellurite resistance protein
MDLLHPAPESSASQLRALAMVGEAADGGEGPPQRAFLSAAQRVVLRADLDLDARKPITPAELAADTPDPAEARQLVRLMVVMAMADGPPDEAQMSLLRTFAHALQVEEPAVEVIGHLAKGNARRFKIAFLRRSHIRSYFRNTRAMLGVAGVIKGVLRFRGVLGEHAATLSKYRALEQLAEDTLGHQFFRHCVDSGIGFPGQKGGFPEGAVFHDVTHVLSGGDTSPEGEMTNAAFQAGYTKGEHDFFTWLISVVLHATGINLVPFDMGFRPGRMGEGRLAEDVLLEIGRGNLVARDLGDRWDCWEYFELPIDVARERLGIVPVESFVAMQS